MRTETGGTSSAVFQANRARGAVTFDAHARDGATRRGQVRESGSLRVRFPSPEGDGLFAVLVNSAGGVAGGDRFEIDVAAGEGARLTLTTAAAEKVYRADGPPAELATSLKVAPSARLAFLPHETILFDGAKVSRRIDIDVAEGGSLLLCGIVVFGRAAMGERLRHGSFVDRVRLRYGGRLAFAETVRLVGDIGAQLARPAIANGAAAVATALMVPGDQALVERLREAAFGGEVGISAWNGFAMARVCAQDAASLRADITALLRRAGGQSLPRHWPG